MDQLCVERGLGIIELMKTWFVRSEAMNPVGRPRRTAPAVSRKELIAAVHAGTDGLHGRAAANAAVEIIIKTIKSALAAGEDVEINSFGKFVPVERAARIGRNFKTGETVEVAPRRSVKFRPAKELRAL